MPELLALVTVVFVKGFAGRAASNHFNLTIDIGGAAKLADEELKERGV
ncbi:MAG: hypothetical protein WCN87_03870 [Chlamydiota bacterium]